MSTNTNTEIQNIINAFNSKNQESKVISPISLLVASSTLALGTHQNSFDTLKEHFGTSGLSRNELLNLVKLCDSKNAQASASMINLMHVNSNFELGENYKNNLVGCVEMISDDEEGPISDEMIAVLNDRINNFTKGLIKNFVTSEAKKAVINIINVIYFNAKWKTPFLLEKTIPKPFTRLDGSEINLPTMHGTENNWYFEDENIQLGYKSYQENDFCMILVVPKVQTHNLTASQIVDTNGNVIFDANKLEEYIENTKYYAIQMQLPKFEQRFKCSDDFMVLVDYKQKDESSNLLQNCYTNSPVVMVHECVVVVDETSTQAAAATSIGVRKCISPAIKGTVELNATRTFNYYIRHISSKTIMFAGTYNGSQ